MSTNTTNPGPLTSSAKPPSIAIDNTDDTPSLITLLFSLPALRDWLKLFLIGGFFETCRRLLVFGYDQLVRSFFICASFDQGDSSYDWVLLWITKQPSWSNMRDVQITTRSSFGRSSPAIELFGEDGHANQVFQSARKISYLPSASLTYSFWYQRRWVTITRARQQMLVLSALHLRRNSLSITVEAYMVQERIPFTYSKHQFIYFSENFVTKRILTRDHNILKKLLQEARRSYMAGQVHNMCVYVSNSSNQWNHVACRAKRSIKSIVLDPGIKDLLLNDARDFLRSRKWYAERGIPFRRGYLLYGAPGSGKTSMIHCMAGELGLDVYIISLSRAGIDDSSLSELVNALPSRCVALMEDIDAAFTHAITRAEVPETNLGDAAKGAPGGAQSVSVNKLSLSGLLNALDGVGAQEGRILFATTNKYSALDPALCRPGRMDVHVEFKNASKYQARELFRRFYLPTEKLSQEDNDDEDNINSDDVISEDLSEKNSIHQEGSLQLPLIAFTGNTHTRKAPELGHDDIVDLAQRFADAISEREWSMASLQGYLMAYKTRPFEAVDEVGTWVLKERAMVGRDSEKEEVRAMAIAVSLNTVLDAVPSPRPVGPQAGCTCGATGIVSLSTAPKPLQFQGANVM